MDYCQTEHYEALLDGMGVKTKRVNGVLFRHRRLWYWDAFSPTPEQAYELTIESPVKGRILGVPGTDIFLGTPMSIQVVDLPFVLQGKDKRAVRAGLNRSAEQGVTVRMCDDFTDWCFSAGELWPNHRRDAEWQYYGGQHTHFVASCKGDVVGTLGIYHWDGRATEIMSRTTPDLNIQERLHVEAMRYACELGCDTFVLGGAGTDGIEQFKKKFRGRDEWVTNIKL